jgi:hypothetical protein
MTIDEVQELLEGMGIWDRNSALEEWEFWEELGPDNAFGEISCFTLTNIRHSRSFDTNDRAWRPVFVTADELLIDPSPEMFNQFLDKTDYFDRPGEFADDLIFQMHRFAFDFYDGYQVREEDLDFDEDELVVSGFATRGAGSSISRVPFETRVKPGHLSRFLTG